MKLKLRFSNGRLRSRIRISLSLEGEVSDFLVKLSVSVI